MTGRRDQSHERVVRTHVLWLLLLACATWILYFNAPQPRGANAGDNLWYLPTAMSLVHHHDLDVSRFRADLSRQDAADVWISDLESDPRLVEIEGRRVNYFPIGAALVALPFVVLGEPLLTAEESPLRRADRLAAIVAASTATIAVLLVFVLIVVLTECWSLAWLAAVFHAFGSPHFATHHSGLWSHNVSQPFVLAALFLFVVRAGRWIWLGALPLACAYVTRPDSSLLIVVYSAYVLVRFPAARRRYVALLGLGFLVFFAWSYRVYGNWVPPYYVLSRVTPDISGEALLGTLVSPNRGLFVFAPLYLLCLMGSWLVWRRRSQYPMIYRLATVVVAGHWIVLSAFERWWGGFSFGPRLFAPVLPLLTILTIPAFQMVGAQVALKGVILRTFLTLALAWSLFVQARGAFASGPNEWNFEPNVDLHLEQVWNWSDMQIFRRHREP